MCQRCVDAAMMHFPDACDQAICDLLWNATAFPFAEPGAVERQIHTMALRSGRNVNKAIDLAWDDTCRELHVPRNE